MNSKNDLDPRLKGILQALQPSGVRDADAASRGKNRYLAQARQLAVTSTGLTRLNQWIEDFKSIFRRKENAPMFNTLISIFLVLATLLGGGGITVAAAQASQPGDFLYPLKTLSEDVFYQVTPGDQDRFTLALDYADRRMAEIQNLLDKNQVPPQAVQLRLQTHLQTALELSVKNIAEAEHLLEQIRMRLEEQLHNRLQQANTNPEGEAVRQQVRETLQVHISWINDGLEKLTQMRPQTQNQQQTQQQGQPGQNGEVPGSANGTGAGQMPNYQYGMGEWNWSWMVTPAPDGMPNQYQHGNGGGQGGSGSGSGK